MGEFADYGQMDDGESAGVDESSPDEPQGEPSDANEGSIIPGEDISSSALDGVDVGAAGKAILAKFSGLRIGGPNGVQAGTDDGSGTGQAGHGGSGTGIMPIGSQVIWKGIIAKASAALGRGVTHHVVRYLLGKFGLYAANALNLTEDEVLFVFGFGKKRKGHRRGPGIYTIAKRIRQAQRLQHTVQRVLGTKLGRGHFARRPRYAFQKRKRRK